MHDPALQPILAVIGHPVAGNPMQFVMERALAAAALDWRFLSLDVAPERLREALLGAAALGFAGLAIGQPHRAAAASLVDARAQSVAAAEATDCLISSDGSWIAENILGAVVLERLQQHVERREIPVAIHGRGIDAALVAALLSLSNYPLTIVGAAEGTKAGETPLASRISEATGHPIDASPSATAPVVVLAGDLDAKHLKWKDPPELLIDCGAEGGEELADQLAEQGTQTVRWIDIATDHALAAFRSWTGIQPDRDTVREAIEEYWAV